jgi:Family of unknown function (DUF5519)
MRAVAGTTLKRLQAPPQGRHAARAVAELRRWPALSVSTTSDGHVVAAEGAEIIHLVSDLAMLHLTGPVIERLGSPLSHCGQVRICPDRIWVVLYLHADPDVELLLTLTSVAIKAHAA